MELFGTLCTCRGAVVGAGSLGTPAAGGEFWPAGSAGQHVLVLSTQHRGDNWVKWGCPSSRLLHASGSCFPVLLSIAPKCWTQHVQPPGVSRTQRAAHEGWWRGEQSSVLGCAEPPAAPTGCGGCASPWVPGIPVSSWLQIRSLSATALVFQGLLKINSRDSYSCKLG